MKACPGLRSGIDRCGSLSFAIRGIPSSIRPLIRHSSDRRLAPYPDTGLESRRGGGGKDTIHMQESKRPEIFIHPLGFRKPICESKVTVESAWTSPEIT